MKKMIGCLFLLICAFSGFVGAENMVVWSKADVSGYDLSADSPGPGLWPSDSIAGAYPSASGTICQQTGVPGPGFVLGGNAADNEGNCSFFWTDFFRTRLPGTFVYSAKLRGEYLNGFNNGSTCNAGPVYIRYGVVSFNENLQQWGDVPDTAFWNDPQNPLCYDMGFSQPGENLIQGQTVRISIPTVNTALTGQFFEIDVTNQLKWMAGNYGNYALVFLTGVGLGSTGKVSLFAFENRTLPAWPYFGTPWTTDGNTMHLLIDWSGGSTMAANRTQPAEEKWSVSPNPFNPQTRITFSMARPGHADCRVFNLEGQCVRTLLSRELSQGKQSLLWDGRDDRSNVLPSGCYCVRLQIAGRTQIKRVNFLK